MDRQVPWHPLAYCQTLRVSGSSTAVRQAPFLPGMRNFRHVTAHADIRRCGDTDRLPVPFIGHKDGLRRLETGQISLFSPSVDKFHVWRLKCAQRA